ncbi:MAG: FKBP-type peptidyl-prolyl cis-trans isomerase [Salibacter sp.]|uniref:FKBP-type peptidyl-prolyl cis-trans isomerase n=1 Tax=Salibacter sp. TaxID=2010995 RepID=UPI0028706EB0|nr:FKBP-type peptidyl-prolyl cis-trans isomerase [Salibacter sp.]MDR9398071.1 FKBP-type peptidyl-prolyl cis-trans isomerase [Salibacter sp.]
MRSFIFLFILSVIFSCNSNSKSSENKLVNADKKDFTKEELMEINREREMVEFKLIEKYIERRGWNMKRSGSGLFYSVYDSASTPGPQATVKRVATIEYVVSLLNGDTVYTSKEDGLKEFVIGMDHVENGLHEGITYMRVGDRARFIIPPRLAHGLAGDRKKIPMHSSIVYDVKLVSLK